MKRRMKKLLCLSLAFTLATALPVSAAGIQEEDFPAEATVIADETVQEESTAKDAVLAEPVLPQGFGDALEDSGQLTLASGTVASQVFGCGTVIDVTTHWNNENKYHAEVKNAASLFQSTGFTVLLDVRQDAPSADTDKVDQRVALTIGNSTNSLHLLTYSGKLGYGGNTSGVSASHVNLTNVEKDGWNCIAMTYEENGGNGHVIVYINGEKAGEVADIGFKLSTMGDLTSMIARTFGTNYLQMGRYDNLVVGNTVLDEAAAKAETAYRKYQKEHLTEADLITIKGSDVDAAAKNMNGLTYKGFGMLNGNSTSNLLLDYKAKAPDKYNEMMQYLFGGDYPLFTHIKMEMGNDGNNSTGAESCTMRYENEEADASRSPGFVMAADAKKINPDVKISILRWEMPGWVADKWKTNTNNEGYEAVYKWYKETIFDAYEKYGYVVDFINPDKNETGNPDTAFIKWFASRVENETQFPDYMDEAARTAYNNIRIIASDENKGLKIVPAMRSDSELYDAVDIIGFHYRTDATDDYIKMADVDDKEVWYSEGCATFGYTELQENKTSEYGYKSIGGYQSPLALMDSFITAFEYSRRTHYMFQPAIGSFYEGIQYGHKELLSARDPWSGYIHYDPALYMLEHFAKFAKTGWEDSDPSANDIWRVITASTKASYAGSQGEHNTTGINGNAGYMTLASPDKKDFSVVFVNNTKNAKTFCITAEDLPEAAAKDLHLWVTETDSYLKDGGVIARSDNGWVVNLPAYSVTTATTLNTNPERTPQEEIHNEDRAVLDTDATGGTNGVTDDKVLYADNFEYKEESSDFLASRGYEPRYMLDTHGAWIVENGRLKQELASSVAQWNGGEPSTVVGDFRWMDYITSVDVQIPKASSSAWGRVTVRSQTGMNWNDSGYTLAVNGAGNWQLYRIGTKVAEGSVRTDKDGKYSLKLLALGNVISAAINGETVATYQDPNPMLSGRVKFSSAWNQIYFDNFLVENVDGGIPYALTMIDGQDDGVVYEGNWTINNPGGGSADNWYRTVSSTSSANAAFTFPAKGCGFSILGANDGSAKLDIYVDGTLTGENVSTVQSPLRGETYSLSDLTYGEHEIKVVVKSGMLNIDALYALEARRPKAAGDVLLSADTSEFPMLPPMAPGSSVSDLPAQVEVQTLDGKTVTKDVVWDTSAGQFTGMEFRPGYITGTVQGGVNAMGLPLTVSIPVEMVVPAKTYYFIDTVDASPTAGATTKPYETVKALAGDYLLNQTSDQFKTSGNTWGLVDTDAGTKSYTDTSDMMATGIYGHDNAAGETLSYAFTLPAGRYKLLSGHREWWSQDRPMTASLTIGGETIDAGDISLSGSSGDLINTKEFALDKEQTVTYTITATGTQAPVISWLAVVEHEHNYVYTDNKNGTHTAVCTGCDDQFTEAHTYVDNVCSLCGSRKQTENPITLAKPAITTTVNAAKGITLKWKKVANAKTYQVYRKAGAGKWNLVKTLSAASWTDAGTKNGVSYQYRIYACRDKVRSEASAAKTICRLNAKKLTVARNVKGKKLSLKWIKNAKASGYQIQYATNKKFTKAKNVLVKGSKKTSKIIKKLKKGKTYYVRIRSYKTSGKKKYYSAWSNVKKVKIKK